PSWFVRTAQRASCQIANESPRAATGEVPFFLPPLPHPHRGGKAGERVSVILMSMPSPRTERQREERESMNESVLGVTVGMLRGLSRRADAATIQAWREDVRDRRGARPVARTRSPLLQGAHGGRRHLHPAARRHVGRL